MSKFFKRLFDIVASASGLIFLSPVFLILIYLIRKNLGSPVFFFQERPGKDGKPFKMVKFRSMRNALDSDGIPLPDSERLTPFGKKLRAASLDELPELWNVLKGEMSLVGPRPLLMQYLPLYDNFQNRRHEMKPGITGWAQVNGRNALSWDEKFACDVWYIDHYSFWLDMKILFLTVRKVFIKEGISAEGEATMPYFTGNQTNEKNNILILSAGRRVELVQDFQTEAARFSDGISAETVKAVLTPNTKAVIVVHLAGMPAEMDGIMALAKEHNLWVIEDCAQAHGATYKGKSVGSIGHVGAWSFCQDKIMTTGGEGGMVTTNDKELWSKMWSYKDHGKSYDAVYCRQHAPGFRWLHESFGTNWRMMEMQAVIGRIQLKRLPEWTARRRENAAKLAESLGKFSSIRLVEVAGYIEHAQYKFYAFVKPEHLKDGWTRDRIVNELNARKVPCYQGSCSEVYLEKAFDDTPWRPKERLKNAVELGDTGLMFLVHPTLTDGEIAFCKKHIEAVLTEAAR